MSRLLIFFFLLPILLCLGGCRTDSATGGGMRYATLIEREDGVGYTLFSVKDPWNEGKNLARYVLVPRNESLPSDLPEGIVLRIPIERAVVTSSVHAALWDELCGGRGIAGVTDAEYIISRKVKQMITQRHISSLGSSMQPDIERIRLLNPDAIWLSPFQNAGNAGWEKAKAPIVWCADYMETSPLGRAEWMRFYGMLVGEQEKADSLFGAVEAEYNHIKNSVNRSNRSKRPSVVCDLLTGAVWYQPGGGSTMGRMIEDAGGAYLWADRKESGSLTLGLESVLARGAKADIWLMKYAAAKPMTYERLADENKAYTHLKPWKERNIYGCNTLEKPFYEEEPFHPERLLGDFKKIFDGEAQDKGGKMYFYTPL